MKMPLPLYSILETRNVYIVTTSNPSIGRGHLTRCMNIASQIKGVCNITFLLKNSDNLAEEIIKASNYQWLPYSPDFISLNSQDIDLLILDDYSISKEDIIEWRKISIKTLEINDIPEENKGADYLINQTPGISETAFHLLPNQTLFLGQDYLLLHPIFLNTEQTAIKKKPYSVLVIMGGSDPFQISSQIAKAGALHYPELIFTIVQGSADKQSEEIQGLAKTHKNILHLIQLSQNEIKQLMLENESVLVPSSTVLLESICCQCAAFTGFLAPNQKTLLTYLEKEKICVNLGDLKNINWVNALKEIKKETIEKIAQNQVHFIQNLGNNKIKNAIEKIVLNTIL